MNGTSHSTIPRIELSGSSYEIGLQHGRLLRKQILSQISIYDGLFMDRCKLNWQQVLDLASKFKPTIIHLAPNLLVEMQGIADGVMELETQKGNGDAGNANLDDKIRHVGLLDILALNARSEIALSKWDDGCTSVAWKLPSGTQILAQNWDWRVSIGENLAMISIVQAGKPKIWMVTEPGIIGKIGFNSSSVGVCLNAIRTRALSTELLPIHLFLRIALESESVSQALVTFEKLGGPASSQHILIADASRSDISARALELTPHGNVYLKPDGQGILVHTNHFLQNKFVQEPPWLSGSPTRLQRATELTYQLLGETVAETPIVATTQQLRKHVFSDRFNSPQAICCSADFVTGKEDDMGTLFNIIMILEPGGKPRAEVLFGKPGPDNHRPVLNMPW